MSGGKFVLCYRPGVDSVSHIDKALWEHICLEGHPEFFLPEEESQELFVSKQVILPMGGSFFYIVSEVRQSEKGDYSISFVQIEDASPDVSVEKIFDYLCEHWFSKKNELLPWLKGRSDLPTKT